MPDHAAVVGTRRRQADLKLTEEEAIALKLGLDHAVHNQFDGTVEQDVGQPELRDPSDLDEALDLF